MENLKPNGQRAKTAITLIWIILILKIVSLIFGYFKFDLLQNAANGVEIPTETATAYDTTQQVLAIIHSIAFVISTITFIQWFRRAYYNLHLRVNDLSQTECWAAGSWFVPVVNLYRPYQIMLELYQETKKLFLKNGLSINENFRIDTLGWWWTLWIIKNINLTFVFCYNKKAESIDELTIGLVVSMIGNIIGISLAIITVKVIKDYSKMELKLSEIKDEE